MIDVRIRLRRAIHLNDLVLVKRIIKNNPQSLQNPDFADKGNTSLHLAAQLGFLDLVEYLISAGHEDNGISRNADWDTPLTLAAAGGHDAVAALLASRFARCIGWKNKQGADALMLTSRSGSSPLLSTLLSLFPARSVLLSAADNDGNTALHYASAYGQLKAIRTLLYAGANPHARNAYSWTPVSYSSTVAAEVYFRNLVAEVEKRRAEGERERRGGGAVRLVAGEEEGKGEDGPVVTGAVAGRRSEGRGEALMRGRVRGRAYSGD